MRLYVVVKKETARALLEGRPPLLAESLVLDPYEPGTYRVTSMTFYHFPWLADVREEGGPDGDEYEHWEQLAVDVPDEVARAHESPCPEGGNSTFQLPLPLVARLLASTASGDTQPAPTARWAAAPANPPAGK